MQRLVEGVGDLHLVPGKGMGFGTLRDQTSGITDTAWFDRRDVDKNEILVPIFSKPCVFQMRKPRLREAKSPRHFVAKHSCPESSALCTLSCYLESLSLSLLPNSGDCIPLARLPSTLSSALSSHLFQKKGPRLSRQMVPQLQLPKPPALSVMYSYLHSRKIKILEIFHKVGQGENQRITREEFITAVKAVSATCFLWMGLSGQDVHVLPLCRPLLGSGSTEK